VVGDCARDRMVWDSAEDKNVSLLEDKNVLLLEDNKVLLCGFVRTADFVSGIFLQRCVSCVRVRVCVMEYCVAAWVCADR